MTSIQSRFRAAMRMGGSDGKRNMRLLPCEQRREQQRREGRKSHGLFQYRKMDNRKTNGGSMKNIHLIDDSSTPCYQSSCC
jgi:hypothetical protein